MILELRVKETVKFQNNIRMARWRHFLYLIIYREKDLIIMLTVILRMVTSAIIQRVDVGQIHIVLRIILQLLPLRNLPIIVAPKELALIKIMALKQVVMKKGNTGSTLMEKPVYGNARMKYGVKEKKERYATKIAIALIQKVQPETFHANILYITRTTLFVVLKENAD